MHDLHTTEAFVLGSIPHGESSRVFRLFTRDLGYLFAHGQGVRDVSNRNRFALTTGQHIRVTLVRGRETWRITGAQSLDVVTPADTKDRVRSAQVRKLFSLCASLTPRETRHDRLYTLLADIRLALAGCMPENVRTIETVSALRMLHLLGYVAEPKNGSWPQGLLASTDTTPEILGWATVNRTVLLGIINGGIESANV